MQYMNRKKGKREWAREIQIIKDREYKLERYRERENGMLWEEVNRRTKEREKDDIEKERETGWEDKRNEKKDQYGDDNMGGNNDNKVNDNKKVREREWPWEKGSGRNSYKDSKDNNLWQRQAEKQEQESEKGRKEV